MAKSKYIDWQDTYITIFIEHDKLLLVFVNDRGDTKVVNWDDNFFYVESLIDTYFEMIFKSFQYWHGNETEQDHNEIKKYLVKYVQHIQRQTHIDLRQCDEDVRAFLGVEK